jgi:hypothetical protein
MARDHRMRILHNEYPQEFVDSIMKPGRSNHPSSDTIYQSMVIIPYVRGISKNSDALGPTSMLGPSSKLNIHSVELD